MSGLLLKLPSSQGSLGPISSIKKGILRHCLLAACVAISRHWEMTEAFNIFELAKILNDIMAMETLVVEDSTERAKICITGGLKATFSELQSLNDSEIPIVFFIFSIYSFLFGFERFCALDPPRGLLDLYQ